MKLKRPLKSFRSHVDGFTFVEVMIAVSIVTLAAVCSSDVLRTGIDRYRKFEARTLARREAAVALQVLARDVRSAFFSGDDPEFWFVGAQNGEYDRLEFFRCGGSIETDPLVESVVFGVEPGPNGGRLHKIIVDEQGNARRIHLCSGVRTFELSYFDGRVWKEEWGWDALEERPFDGIRGLPQAVSVRISFEGKFSSEFRAFVPVMVSLLNGGFHV